MGSYEREEDDLHRRSLVRRHNPVVLKLDPRAPLSVGNGEFAFTADIAGLQTFPEAYEQVIPLCTQAQWGWHTAPNPKGFKPEDLRLEPFDTYGRPVGYPTRAEGQKELFTWLRENPHRLHLAKIGLLLARTDGAPARPADLSGTRQILDLWTGTLTSLFQFQGVPVAVETCCHPALDLVVVAIRSPLIGQRRLAVTFEFPYGSPRIPAADWKRPEAHRSTGTSRAPRRFQIRRELDRDSYSVSVGWERATGIRRRGPHRFLLHPAPDAGQLEFVCLFSPRLPGASLPTPRASFEASANHWDRFWSGGGALELAASRDPRAKELERRVVLSEYLTAIQCAGSAPPQETGLTCNSWYGKFHLEMHWWHAAHFALWGRIGWLEKSLAWYESILPRARQTAGRQGYRGARWPKMAGPDGIDSPSPIGPLLIWQQPHVIAYAELCYQAHPDRATLERYQDLVCETSEFMASFAVYDARTKRYVLGIAGHPRAGKSSPTGDLEPDVRNRVPGTRARLGWSLAPAVGLGPGAWLGAGPDRPVTAAGSGRRLPGA